MKEPKCKFCGGKHYQYQCWAKKKQDLQNKQALIGHQKPQKQKKHKKMETYTSQDRKALVRELDAKVSNIVRKRGSRNGMNQCYTCGRIMPWKQLDCGHYISRRYVATRFDFDNMRPQCIVCNRELGGNLKTYDKRLRLELGNEKVDELWRKARKETLTTGELYELYEKLTRLERNGMFEI